MLNFLDERGLTLLLDNLNNTINTHTHKKYDDLIKYNLLRNDIVTDKSNKVSFEEVNEYKIYTAEKPTQQTTYTIHQDTTHSLTYTAEPNCEHNIFTVPNYNALVWRKNSESVSGEYGQDWLDFKITNNGNINYLPQYLCQIKFKIVSTPSTMFLSMYKKDDTEAVFNITMNSQDNYLHINDTNLGIRADEWFILTFKVTPNHLSLCCNNVSCYEGSGRCDFTLNEIDSFRITSSTQDNHETHINLISGDYCGGPRLSKYVIKADDKLGDTYSSERYLNNFKFKIYNGLSVEDFDEVSGLLNGKSVIFKHYGSWYTVPIDMVQFEEANDSDTYYTGIYVDINLEGTNIRDADMYAGTVLYFLDDFCNGLTQYLSDVIHIDEQLL